MSNSSKYPTLSILMPVYNEKDTLLDCLEAVLKSPYVSEIIMVDDGSKDGTRDIVKSINNEKVKVFLHKHNVGKGAAVCTALAKATGDYVLIQDADLEYNPEEYIKLLKPVIEDGAWVVYGSRFSGVYKNMRFLSKFGNKFLTLMTSVLYGAKLTDMETCYKLMKRSEIKDMNIKSHRFDFEPEITAKILKKNIPIIEVPITYHGRAASEGKKITYRDGIVAAWTLIKYRFIN
jgi:glycosyltransferase involved in cell wall biosynthesis